MRDHCNNRELSVTLAMLLPTAVGFLLVLIHCICECMLSGPGNSWQGYVVLCLGFFVVVFIFSLGGERKNS